MLIDSSYDNGQYSIILFKGIDSFGHQIILFVTISPKNDSSNLITAIENYKLAGFKTPTTLIVDQSSDCLEALDKCDFKPKFV